MAFFFPLLDGIIGLFWLVGSPALGYIVLRAAWPMSAAWNGLARVAGASVLGMVWSALVGWTLAPGILNPVALNPNQLAEFASMAGMGLLLLTLFTALSARYVGARVIHPWNPAAVTTNEGMDALRSAPVRQTPVRSPVPMRTPTFNVPEKTMPAQSTPESRPINVYKPSQLKVNPLPAREREAPKAETPRGDEDVLSLLREEEAASGKPGFDSPAPASSRAPMGKMTEFAGFDDTLAQLKRDLKDFNESVESHARKKYRKP